MTGLAGPADFGQSSSISDGGDSTGRHEYVAFAAECVAVQFAPALPILADSRVHGSHEGDPNLRGVLPHAT
jgi:hypothetical protein